MHILHKQELSIFVFKSARCLAHDGGGHIFPDGHPHLDESARGAAREWEWRTRFFFYEEIFFVGKNAVCKINFFQTEPGNAVDARNKFLYGMGGGMTKCFLLMLRRWFGSFGDPRPPLPPPGGMGPPVKWWPPRTYSKI